MSSMRIRKVIIIVCTDVVHKNLPHAIHISVKKLFRQYLFPVVISWLVDVTVQGGVVSSNTNNGRISQLPSLRRSYNPLRPGDSYMRHWTGSSLVHVMACRSFEESISVKILSKLKYFHWRICIRKCCSPPLASRSPGPHVNKLLHCLIS